MKSKVGGPAFAKARAWQAPGGRKKQEVMNEASNLVPNLCDFASLRETSAKEFSTPRREDAKKEGRINLWLV